MRLVIIIWSSATEVWGPFPSEEEAIAFLTKRRFERDTSRDRPWPAQPLPDRWVGANYAEAYIRFLCPPTMT